MAVDKNGKSLPPGIRQRANGKYEGRVKVDYQSYSVYGATITEVKKAMVELRYKLEHGEFVASSKMTVAEWFKTWIEQYKDNQVKVGTVIIYNDCFKRYIEVPMGEKKLTAVLSGCFKQAMKNGLIERNPVPLATLAKSKPREQRRVLTQEEQGMFFEYAQGSYLYNLFALAIRTGLRGGEIRGLKLSDVNKMASLLHVRRTLKYASGRSARSEYKMRLIEL